MRPASRTGYAAAGVDHAMSLIAPHGGHLIDRLVPEAARAEASARAARLPRVRLNAVQLSDLFLIATGAYSPLTGFLGEADYRAAADQMHLANGLPWSLPITLAVSPEVASGLRVGAEVALADERGEVVGTLELSEIYSYDKAHEARQVYRTAETAHPGVARLAAAGDRLLAGDITLLRPPELPFAHLPQTPRTIRSIIAERGWRSVVGFQTRNPVHRAHEYIQKCALEIVDGLLLHPLMGETKADDIPADVRLRCYEVLLANYYPQDRVILGVLPAAMRYAGPREAIFHALMRKNHGCTHFIVGRDHAGVGTYYSTYDAQKLFDQFAPDALGITPLRFENSFYCRRCSGMASDKTCPHGPEDRVALSGTAVRAMLRAGELPPPEFSRPEVARVLVEAPHGGD